MSSVITLWATQGYDVGSGIYSFSAPGGSNQFPSIICDNNGNSYVAYYTNSVISGSGNTNSGLNDIVVFKLDINGTLIWQKQLSTFNTSSADGFPSITIDNDKNIYISYQTVGGLVPGSGNTVTGTRDIVIFKLDNSGNHLWSIQKSSFNSTGNNTSPSIAASGNGYIYVAYLVTSQVGDNFSGSVDVVVLKISNTGTVIWVKELFGFNTPAGVDEPSITVDYDNNPCIVATTYGLISGSGNTITGAPDVYVFKLNNNDGSIIWTTQNSLFNSDTSSYSSSANDINIDRYNNIYISYYVYGSVYGNSSSGDSDIVLTKFDTNGNHIWSKQTSSFNTSSTEDSPAVSVTFNGNIYVAYTTSSAVSGNVNTGGVDTVVAKFDTNGNLLWTQQNNTFNTDKNDNLPSISSYGEDDCLVAYNTNGVIGFPFAPIVGDLITVYKLHQINPYPESKYRWIRQLDTYNNPNDDTDPKISSDSINNCYVCFTQIIKVDVSTSRNIVITKFDKNGNLLWVKSDSTINNPVPSTQVFSNISTNSIGTSFIVYNVNAAITGGNSSNVQTGSPDVCVVSIDTNGNTIYSRQYSIFNTTGSNNEPVIVCDNKNNCYISYYTNSTVSGGTSSGGYDIVVFKLDPNGDFIWSKQLPTFNTSSADITPSITVDKFDNCYVAFNTSGATSGNSLTGTNDVAVVKIDKNGNQIWVIQNSQFNSIGDNFNPSIVAMDNGDFYLSFHDEIVITITRFDKNGNLVWKKNGYDINSYLLNKQAALATDFCKNCYAVYMTNNNTSSSKYDIRFIKLDKHGNLISSGFSTTVDSTNNINPDITVGNNGQQFMTYYTDGLAIGSGNTQAGKNDVVVFSV